MEIGIGFGISHFTPPPIEVKENEPEMVYPVDFTVLYGKQEGITPTTITLDYDHDYFLNSGEMQPGETYTIPSYEVEIEGMENMEYPHIMIGIEAVTGQQYLVEPTENGRYTVPSYTFSYSEDMPVWVMSIQSMGVQEGKKTIIRLIGTPVEGT